MEAGATVAEEKVAVGREVVRAVGATVEAVTGAEGRVVAARAEEAVEPCRVDTGVARVAAGSVAAAVAARAEEAVVLCRVDTGVTRVAAVPTEDWAASAVATVEPSSS
jgi:hypothetical protein